MEVFLFSLHNIAIIDLWTRNNVTLVEKQNAPARIKNSLRRLSRSITLNKSL